MALAVAWMIMKSHFSKIDSVIPICARMLGFYRIDHNDDGDEHEPVPRNKESLATKFWQLSTSSQQSG